MRYFFTLLGIGFLTCGTVSFSQDKSKTGKDPEIKKEAEDKIADTTPEDVKTLKDVKLPIEGPALLDYFRTRTFKPEDPKKVELLIRQLGDEDFAIREKAYRQLTTIGPSALPAIKEAAVKHAETEGRFRALDLKNRIEAKQEPTVQIAAARMVGRLKPRQAAEVLLNYLPFADPSTVDEFCKALGEVAVQKGKTEAAVIAALTDKLALKRGAAAEALLRAKIADQLDPARALLKDPEPAVRLRTALALVPYREKEIVPVLVETLKHLPADQLWAAQDILENLAGDQAPTVSLGDNEATRKVAYDAWAAWLKKNDKLDLTKLGEPVPLQGLTVIAQFSNQFIGGRPPMGKILEIDKKKEVKWKFDVPNNTVDPQIVGPDRVLIAEFGSVRVTERDFKGNILLDIRTTQNPIGVQRMPNGNTFVVMQRMLAEYDKEKKQVYSYQRINNNDSIFRAKKLRNGEVLLLTQNGNLVRLDKEGKEIGKSFFVGRPNNLFGNFDVLPNGNILIPDTNQNRIAEFTPEGKDIPRNWKVDQPSAVVRLANGNLMVTSSTINRVSELDRNGRVVWSHALTDGMPYNARKR